MLAAVALKGIQGDMKAADLFFRRWDLHAESRANVRSVSSPKGNAIHNAWLRGDYKTFNKLTDGKYRTPAAN